MTGGRTIAGGRARSPLAGAIGAVTPALAFAVLLLAGNAAAQTLRVAPSGQNAAGCGSAAAPCRTIQYAVNQIASSGTVLVAGSPAGTRYTYDIATDVCDQALGMTAIACVINKEIAIRGGFTAASWSLPDPAANLTIIDGQDLHRGVLVTSTGPATRLELEGFTVENCRGQWSPNRPGLEQIFAFGGGFFADGAQHVVLRNLTFRSNLAIGKSVTTESDFGGNGAGGGAAFRLVDDGLLDDVRFEGNAARGGDGPARAGYGAGGGLFTNASRVIGRALRFTDNVAQTGDSSGNGVGSDGERAAAFGGAACFQEGSDVVLQQVAAVGNSAIATHAGAYGPGAFGGAFKAELADVTLIDVEMRSNQALGGDAVNGWMAAGGGVEAIHSDVTLIRAAIVDNLARGGDGTTGEQGAAGGGGVYSAWVFPVRDASLTLVNSIVAGNRVEQGGGTIVTGGGGGGLFLQGAPTRIQHATIAGNTVSQSMAGQGILLIESSVGDPGARFAEADIEWSVIADHLGFQPWQMAALHVRPGNTVRLRPGLFANNAKSTNADGTPLPAGAFVGLDTMTTSASASFAAPGAPSFDYHLTETSPARDIAIGSAIDRDLEGDARWRTGTPDAGADEWVGGGAGLGVISGVAHDAAGGPAIAVAVAAVDVDSGAILAWTLTDDRGAYALERLPAGRYAVRFGSNDGPGGWIGEWYANAADLATATAIALTAGGAATADATLARAKPCAGFAPTIVGSIGPDVIRGTPGRDVIAAGAGDDDVRGAAGDDVICGEGSDDVLNGGGGRDFVDGGPGNDMLLGAAGPDVLVDRNGADTLKGGRGNDDLSDPRGANSLVGGAGTDTCVGAAGNVISSCEN